MHYVVVLRLLIGITIDTNVMLMMMHDYSSQVTKLLINFQLISLQKLFLR